MRPLPDAFGLHLHQSDALRIIRRFNGQTTHHRHRRRHAAAAALPLLSVIGGPPSGRLVRAADVEGHLVTYAADVCTESVTQARLNQAGIPPTRLIPASSHYRPATGPRRRAPSVPCADSTWYSVALSRIPRTSHTRYRRSPPLVLPMFTRT
jgi:hypothetical protein